jgi:hypothetical protein
MPTWAQKSPSNRKRFNENWRKWYRENRERKIAWQKRRREELRAWFRDLKTTKSCARCGERTVECLQFHRKASPCPVLTEAGVRVRVEE